MPHRLSRLTLLFCILLLNAVFLMFNALRCFNFHDMCFAIDGGWRILNGQRPYVDFIYFSGPVHLYLYALFFKIFGFGKTAILAYLLTTSSLIMVIVFLLSSKHLPLVIASGTTFLTGVSFYWSISHPWHSQTAHLWGVMGIVLLAGRLPFQNKRMAFWTGVVCGWLGLLSFMTKSNIGGAYSLLFFVVLAMTPFSRSAVLGCLTGFFTEGAVWMLCIAPREYLRQMLEYSQHRFGLMSQTAPLFDNFYWIPFVIVLTITLPHWKKMKELLAIFTGIFLIAVFTIYSEAIEHRFNIFLWGLLLTFGFILIYRVREIDKARGRERLWTLAAGALAGIMLWWTVVAVKYGFELKVWAYGGKDPVGDYEIKIPALQGWRCRRDQGIALDGLAEYIQTHVPSGKPLLVATDMQILYALTRRDSFRKIPVFDLQEGDAPVPGRQAERVRAAIRSAPPDWIVTDLVSYHKVLPYIGITPDIRDRYVFEKKFGRYAILKNR